MVDTLSPEQRSERMSRIRSLNTRPEVSLRKALHRLGFRFRLHDRRLPGKPDIVLPKHHAIIQVHGCFWHRHAGCKVATVPKSNTAFWLAKFSKNVVRDAQVRQQLQAAGWRVFVVWECDLATQKKADAAAVELAEMIQGKGPPSTFESKEITC